MDRPLRCGISTDNPGRPAAGPHSPTAGRPGRGDLLEGGGELRVCVLEGPGRTVEVLAHARQALDDLGGPGAELGVGRLELLAGRVRHVPARDQVVDQLLQPGEITLYLLLTGL